MHIEILIQCRECMGHGAVRYSDSPSARQYGCEECGGHGEWTVSGDIVPERAPGQGFDGLELINFDCPKWLNNTERSDAEERLWIRYQEREAA